MVNIKYYNLQLLIIYCRRASPRLVCFGNRIVNMRSLDVHVELLLCSSLLQVLHLFLLVVQSLLSLCLLLLLALEVELLVELGGIGSDIAFGLLEVVLQHASHAIEFECLVGVHLIFESFLLLTLPLLLDLLIQPLFLLILEEFLSGVVLYVWQGVLKSSP